MENEEQGEKNFNPNWKFVGKLKDVSVCNLNEKSFFLVKTDTTAFLAEVLPLDPLHFGQTVKFSKRDNTVRVGSQVLHRLEQNVEYVE